MTNNASEGDFDSIIEDDESLDGTPDDIETLDVLSNRDALLNSDNDDEEGAESEESKLKALIEKGRAQGYLTYDSIAQAKIRAKKHGEQFQSKVVPIVVGTFTATGSTQSIAKENDVRLLTIPSDITTEDLKPFITKELKNLLTNVR